MCHVIYSIISKSILTKQSHNQFLHQFHPLTQGPISHRKNLRPSPSPSSSSTMTIPIEKQLMSPRGSIITPLVVLPRASHQPKQNSPFGQRKVYDNGNYLNFNLLSSFLFFLCFISYEIPPLFHSCFV